MNPPLRLIQIDEAGGVISKTDVAETAFDA
jgi:hypothetical protein